MQLLDDAGTDTAGFNEVLDSGFATLTRANSAAAKNALAATRSRMRNTRISTKAIMDALILTF